MALPWYLIGGLAVFFGVFIMTLFSSCCNFNDSNSDSDTVNPRRHATAAARETPVFSTIRYSDTGSGNPPSVDAASDRTSQLSPRATPSGQTRPPRAGTSSTAAPGAPQTSVKTYGTTQDVSPSVYSQPSQPRTPPSAGTIRRVGRQDEGVEAVGTANAQQTSEQPVSMNAIRKLMGDERDERN
ncbi:hypothetical protein N0V86_008772 [Didymella sp. IMI 355093]|nr:hypothetical protein N0V86_008772 [Didymella sp. IMI 355093]